jgi:hypothetical protein
MGKDRVLEAASGVYDGVGVSRSFVTSSIVIVVVFLRSSGCDRVAHTHTHTSRGAASSEGRSSTSRPGGLRAARGCCRFPRSRVRCEKTKQWQEGKRVGVQTEMLSFPQRSCLGAAEVRACCCIHARGRGMAG